MNIKIGKVEINIPAWAFVVGALVGDSMYANHCKKKSYENLVDKLAESSNLDSKEDEEES